ncbi:carbohydrate ABC transporter permease [Cryptosporangium aurantiacum]|uniref:Carbohydrate ABC transporter membrane protein 2, CUT1 family n=1 Tax=Cryptosporangium aurantiacum TaxID=134849 RepID=A0A1M7R378_9ACTN|nr:carbohydrate ABC transporter permease [Cryptosporangium aurantiacum]SHN39533.1 carbohydrate ABC transporter membrane protein 2, CUT1 family [Cryptosporangium aurantiacum]
MIRWVRFGALTVITAVVLVPLVAVVALALQPRTGVGHGGLTLDSMRYVLAETASLTWLRNSLVAAGLTTLAAVLVAAPAGYVLSRGRGKVVSGYSLLLFSIQSFPHVILVIPLFVMFASLGLIDSVTGLTLVYIAAALPVACWMMAAYIDSIPVSLEEAAWIDGCSVFGSFWRVVVRNSLPGLLSTAIFSFLIAWNDYLVALVFLRSSDSMTLPIGLQSFFQQDTTNWGPVMSVAVIMLLPPVLVFAALNRYFSVGGIGGALAGQ